MYFYANKASDDFCWLPVCQAEIKLASKKGRQAIDDFTVEYLVVKPLIYGEAEGDLVVIETSI